tara:strand:- start:829 stop:1083 length:255 start_codon:yes stop_codon:yes gene_type:complete
MIEISIYYLLGSIIALPGITFYITNKYYIDKINKIVEEYDNLQIFDSVNIEGPEILSPKLSYKEKQNLLEKHLQNINNNILDQK